MLSGGLHAPVSRPENECYPGGVVDSLAEKLLFKEERWCHLYYGFILTPTVSNYDVIVNKNQVYLLLGNNFQPAIIANANRRKMEDKTPLEAIHRLMPEINESREKIKTIREQLKDVMEQNDEYRQLEAEIKELANKRAEARKLLLADKDYQKINADLEDERLKQKDLQEILSHYLVSYYNETKKTEVTDQTGETRQLLLSAKLGKATAS